MRWWLFLVLLVVGAGSAAWAKDVEVGGKVLLRLDNAKQGEWLSKKIESLMLQGADPKQLHLERRPKLVLICWGKQTLVVVSKQLAHQNKSEQLALAQGWLDRIRSVAELGFLKLSSSRLEMPVGGEASVEISGLAQGPLLMGDTGGHVELFEDGSGRLKVVAKSVGKAKVIIQRGKARAVLIVHIKDWAGYPPEQISVKVTGDPAPSDLVLDAALRALSGQSRVNPGCRLTTPKLPSSLPSIPNGKELRFSLPIRIEGSDDYYPVTRDVPVLVRSLGLEAVEPNLLLVSNRPEMLNKDGILLDYTIKASEPSRLMYSHMNDGHKKRWLWVNLTNPTSEPVEVLVDWSYAGPSRNEVLAGHEAAVRFGERLTRRTGFVLAIQPRSTVELAAHELKRRELLSGFVNLRILQGQKLQIRVLNKEAPGRNDGSRLANLGAPFNPFKIHPHGVFAQPFFEEWLDYAAGQAPLEFNFGESPWLIDFETGLPNTGNFGVLYRWHLTLSNPSNRPARFGLTFTPKNGAAAGTFVINGKVFQASFRARNEETPLSSFTVGPQQELNVDLLTFPEASSSYPATLCLRELRGSEPFGREL